MTSINPLIRGIQQINQEGRMALCGYFLTGYSTPKNFYHCIRALHNIDVFEFGIPSENPYMDGPIISSAHRHVTENLGVDAEVALSLLGGLKSLAQPRFVMTYTQDGRKLDGFLRLCLLNGIHGVVAPDVAPREASRIALVASSLNMAYIGFIHDQMKTGLIEQTLEICDIVYLKVAAGLTGTKTEINNRAILHLAEQIAQLRSIKPHVLICAGIGIQSAEQVQLLGQLDINMIIVGTSVLKKYTQGIDVLTSYIDELKQATRIQRISEVTRWEDYLY